MATARTDARLNANTAVGAKPYAQAPQTSVGAYANGEGEKGDDDDDDDVDDVDFKEEDLEDVLND